jgi:hypothetical protein
VKGHDGIVSRPLFKPLFLEAGLAWNKKRYMPRIVQLFIDSFRGANPSTK